MYITRKTEAGLGNQCCRGRANIITYSECLFVALVLHQEKRIGRIILSPMDSSALPYHYTLSHNITIFAKCLFEIKCVLVRKFLIHRKFNEIVL